MSKKRLYTASQSNFLHSHSLCRFAISDLNRMPHVTPVVYAMDFENPIIAIDYGTKKLQILRKNKKVSLVVDDEAPNRGLVIQGECEIYEKGETYLHLLDVLLEEIEIYRKHPWKEGESPILKVTPQKVASWGI